MAAKVLETSPDGLLRLRALSGGKAVVELDNHGVWVWCVWRSQPLEQAKITFSHQLKFHQ